MEPRSRTLQRILESTGCAAGWTEERRRDLLARLEAEVEVRIKSGISEAEAVADALEGIDDLSEFRRRAPEPAAEAPRPGRLSLVIGTTTSRAWTGCYLLVLSACLAIFIYPPCAGVFARTNLPMPVLFGAVLDVGLVLRAYWYLASFLLILLIGAVIAGLRSELRGVFALTLLILGLLLFASVLLVMAIPLVQIFNAAV